MKNIYLSLLLCFLSVTIGFSQSMSVSSFKLLETDLTANTAGTIEKDQNGQTAALIKVVTTNTGFTFDGGALGIVKAIQKSGEVWVYIPRGAQKLTITHPQLGVLRDYYFPFSVESGRTYELVLATKKPTTDRTSQYVVFQLEPKNAVVVIDGNMLQTTDGVATKMMKFGTYDYQVQAPDHLPEAGKVTINDPDNKHVVKIKLKPNYAQLTLKVDNKAEIWVNGELKGTGTWTGNLSEGTYVFEAKKEGYHSTSTTREITPGPQTIQLQAPVPTGGDADIASTPPMADIYIDGTKVGQTPEIIKNVSVGSHVVMLKKKGYADYSATIDIQENETTKHVVTLKISKEREKAIADSIAKVQADSIALVRKQQKEEEARVKAKLQAEQEAEQARIKAEQDAERARVKKIKHDNLMAKLDEQDKKTLVFGIKAGYNMATAQFDSKYKGTTGGIGGFHIGATADMRLADNFHFCSGLILSNKGYTYENKSNGVDEEGKGMFIDIPLLASLRLPLGATVKLSLDAGPYAAICAGGSVKDQYSPEVYNESFSSAYTSFDYGVQAGVGLIILHHYNLGVSYQIGMSKYHNKNLMIGIGYRF